jgi:hypothetical protein
MNQLSKILESGGDTAALAAHLDGMRHEERVAATRTLPRALFAVLFERVAGARSLSLDALVPPGRAPLSAVRHVGTNTMPVFRGFEKPMYRQASGHLAGRNVQTWEAFTGPGYFTVEPFGQGEVLLNYLELPREAPGGWPAIRSNARGLSYFVFRGMKDVVRGVSEHVVIGRAARDGKDMRQYFVLVREP